MSTPFTITYLPLIDYGDLGVSHPETEPGATLDDICADLVGGQFSGDFLAVYKVQLLAPTTDESHALAAMVHAAWKRGEEPVEAAREFAEKFGFDFTDDEPEGSYADFVREHSTLNRAGQGV